MIRYDTDLNMWPPTLEVDILPIETPNVAPTILRYMRYMYVCIRSPDLPGDFLLQCHPGLRDPLTHILFFESYTQQAVLQLINTLEHNMIMYFLRGPVHKLLRS